MNEQTDFVSLSIQLFVKWKNGKGKQICVHRKCDALKKKVKVGKVCRPLY